MAAQEGNSKSKNSGKKFNLVFQYKGFLFSSNPSVVLMIVTTIDITIFRILTVFPVYIVFEVLNIIVIHKKDLATKDG